MAQDIATLGIKVDARQVAEGDRALDKFERTGQRADKTTDKLNATMQRLARMASLVTAALGVREIVQMADAWASMNGRLSLVTNSSRQLAQVQGQLFDLAQRTRGGLEGTVDLYTKMTRAVQTLNKSDADRLRVTESVNKALIVGGGAASSQAAALVQLAQGFGANRLGGEELNSILEQTPRLAQAIADGMGRNIGDLKGLAAEGKLTAQVVFNALQSQAGKLDAEFARMPTTISQGMTQVQNALLRAVGMFDEANQLSAGFAGTLTTVANNIGLVIAALAGLATTGALVWIRGVVSGLLEKVAASNAAALAARTAAAADVATAAAASSAAAATAADTAAKIAGLTAQRATIIGLRESVVVQLAVAQQNLNSARTAMAAAAAAGAQSFALRALKIATLELAAAEAARVAAVAEMAALGRAQTAISAQITAATIAQAAATRAATVASKASTAASIAAAGAGSLATRALGLLGGPIGIITTLLGLGATAWMMWGDKAKEGETKAAEAVEDKSADIIAELDAQIAKFEERNRLAEIAPDIKGEKRSDVRLREIRSELGTVAADKTLNADTRTALLMKLGREYDTIATKADRATKAESANAAGIAVDKRAAWLKKNTQYVSDEAKLANALAEAQAELGDAYTKADEAMIRASFGKKAGNAAASAAADQRKTAADYLQGLEDERRAIGATEQQLTMLAAARAAAEAPAGMRTAIMEKALALTVERQAYEELEAARTAADAADKQRVAADAAEFAAARDRVAAMKTEVETYGMGAAAVTRYTLAKLAAQQVTLETADGDNSGELAKVQALILANEQVMQMQNAKDDLDQMFATDKVESFGAALRDAFGSAGSALGQLTDLMQGYEEKQRANEKARAAAVRKYAGDETRTAKEIAKINDKATGERLGAYADMAGAAKGFFKENTAGYKVLDTVEKAYRAAEMARVLESLYTRLFVTTTATGAQVAGNAAVASSAVASSAVVVGANAAIGTSAAVAGVATQALGDPYTAFARMAAMAAIMVGLGFAVSGGRRGGGGGMSAADRQKQQGAGSVLGDSAAKSQSIANALGALEDNSNIALEYTSDMLATLRSINNGISGMAAMVARTAGLTGSAADLKALGVGASTGTLGFNSKRTELTDQGIAFGSGQTAGSIMANGVNASKYADLTSTKSSFWGLSKSSKSSTQTEALEAELTKQMGLTVESMVKAVETASLAVGVSAEGLAERLAGVGLGFDRISLKGLTGEEVEKQIAAMFSMFGDSLARTGVEGGLDKFQKAGEGQFETLVRVAAGVDAARFELERFGLVMIGLPDVIEKQGDVSAELVRQTIMLAETSGGALSGVGQIMKTLGGDASELAATYADLLDVQRSMTLAGLDAATLGRDMIRGAGDLGALQSGLDAYFETFFSADEQLAAKTAAMSKQFAALGLAMPTDGAGFRDLVEKSGPKLQGQLFLLAEAFGELLDAGKEAASVGEKMQGLLDGVADAVDAEKDLKTKAHNEFMKVLEKSIGESREKVGKLTAASKAARGFLDALKVPGEELAQRGAAQGELSAMLAAARGGAMPDADRLQKALSTLSQDSAGSFASELDYRRDVAQTAGSVAELAALNDEALSIEERNLAALEELKLTTQTAFDAEMERLDGVLKLAQAQLDATNGTWSATLSVVAALEKYNAGLKASGGNGGRIAAAYGESLGRAPDAAGMAFWQKQLESGVSVDAIVDAIATSPEATSWRAGKNEPMPTAPTAFAAGSEAVAAAVKELKTMMEPALFQITKNTGKTADATEAQQRATVAEQEP